jgi:hypothetical protein
MSPTKKAYFILFYETRSKKTLKVGKSGLPSGMQNVTDKFCWLFSHIQEYLFWGCD